MPPLPGLGHRRDAAGTARNVVDARIMVEYRRGMSMARVACAGTLIRDDRNRVYVDHLVLCELDRA